MKSKLYPILIFLIIGSSACVFGQDATTTEEPKEEEKPSFTFSGSIDTYFHMSNMEDAAPGTSFANLKGFSLGMANIIGSYAGEKVGFTADLVFGPRGYDAVFANTYTFPSNPSPGQRVINQLFAYYKFSDGVMFTLGQFNTFVGMETITPVPNTHYSTSYLFTNGPFNHTGLKADFTFGGGWVGKLAIMNPTDLVEFNPVDTYTLGGQLGFANDGGGAWLNFLYGDPDGKFDETGGVAANLFQIDLTTGWNFGEKFYLGANVSSRSVPFEDEAGDDLDPSSFFGVALYPKLTFSESFALGLRLENFSVKNGYPAVTPFGLDDEGDGSVTAVTLSGNIMSGNLRIIPEIRMDSMSEDTFLEKDSETSELSKSMLTFNLAAVYKF